MADRNLVRTLDRILRIATEDSAVSDATLLDRFISQGDAAALELLVRRYQRLVFGICQRVLQNVQDAEDAFQATFLILARKAASVSQRESIGGWLHQVATRAALAARAVRAQRLAREQPLGGDEIEVASEADSLLERQELWSVVDEEVSQLPGRFRTPVILCYFEGKTVDEAAQLLGCPRGTVASRLGRARERLRVGLSRRGFPITATTLTAGLGQSGFATAAAEGLVSRTGQVVASYAAGHTVASPIACKIVALSEEVLRSMFLRKVTGGLGILLVSLIVLGSSLSLRQHLGTSAEPPTTSEVSSPLDKDPLPPQALARLGTLRFRHGGFISSLAYSPDGKLLASGGWFDPWINLWDPRTGRKFRSLEGHKAGIRTLAFSPDGKLLVAAGDKSNLGTELRLWNVATGKLVFQQFQANENTWKVAFAPDGKTIASAHSANRVRLWDAQTGKIIRVWEGNNKEAEVYSLAFTPDGKMLASAGTEGTIRFFDVKTGKESQPDLTPEGRILALAFSPDGTILAAACNKTIYLFRARNHEVLHRVEGIQEDVNSIAFFPDGKTLVSEGHDQFTRLWDVASGKQLRQFPRQSTLGTNVSVSPDGKTLAFGAGYGSGVVQLGDVQTGALRQPLRGMIDPLYQVAFLRDGQTVAARLGVSQVVVWSGSAGQESSPIQMPVGAEGCLLCADRSTLAVTTADGTLLLLDIPSGRERMRCTLFKKTRLLAVSDDNKRAVVEDALNQIEVYDLSTAKMIRRFKPGYRVFTPDLKLVAEVVENQIVVADLDSKKELSRCRVRGDRGESLAFSPDGRMLFVNSSDSTLRLVETATGKECLRLQRLDARVNAVAFSHDRRKLVTGGCDGIVRLWDLRDGKELQAFPGHLGYVNSVAFSADGCKLVSGGSDTTALIWDIPAACRDRKMAVVKLDRQQQGDLWDALADDNAAKAYAAMQQLVAAEAESVALCQERLLEPPPTKPEQIQRWITQLDAEEFSVREQASHNLKRVGPDAGKALVKALKCDCSPEARQRLEDVLDTVQRRPLPLRTLRALELLEQIGTAEAANVLRLLARKTGDLRLRCEVERVLRYLAAKRSDS